MNSRLQHQIDSGNFVITCELTPPKGTDLSRLFATADSLKDYVHAFNLTDSHAARMAIDPTAVAHLLLDRGIEPIVQMTSRDKNRIALQSGMLGAAALGVPNLVFMGGDPPKNGDHPDAKPVFDLFASQLLDAANALRSGTDLTGNNLNGTPNFCIGAVVNPGATNLEGEIENMHRKIESGAAFLQTQAVYDAEAFTNFLSKAGDVSVPILAGIIPIKSTKMAKYMNERVPGITVPENLIQQIADAEGDSERVKETSISIAANTIRDVRSASGGLHIMAIGWEDKIPAILEQAEVRI